MPMRRTVVVKVYGTKDPKKEDRRQERSPRRPVRKPFASDQVEVSPRHGTTA